MIFHEYSLIFFTVLAQTAVGGYLLLSARALIKGDDMEKIYRYKVPMFILWVVMGLGFMFSTTHLGSPWRAFNALNQVGSSWLSNEIFFGASFFAVGGTQWLLSVLKKGSLTLQRGLMLAAMLLGIVFMYSMIKVYMIDTVPTWFNIYTPLSFMMTIAVAGLLMYQFVLTMAEGAKTDMSKRLICVIVLAVIASLVITVAKANFIDQLHSSITSASELVSGLGEYLGMQVLLLMAGLAVWFFPIVRKTKITALNLSVAMAFILSSELIGRGLFYSQHMTSGL